MTIRILIAEDEPIVRAGVAMLLAAQVGLEVVGEAGDGSEALAGVRRLQPDVVVMDIRMPGVDGVTATRLIAESHNESDRLTRVLISTTFHDDDLVLAALRAGASGFILKAAAALDLPAAVRRVAAGDAWLDPVVAGGVIRALCDVTRVGSTASTAVTRLTPREREVLTLIADGLSNEDIAVRLVLSLATVKTHVSRILMKSGSRDRAQAVALAYQSGLVLAPPFR